MTSRAACPTIPESVRQLLSRQPLRRQVLLGAVVLILPLFLAVIWSASQTFDEREADLREQTEAIVSAEQAYLNQQLNELDLLAASLGRYGHARALDGVEGPELLQSMVADRPLLLNIVTTDTGGLIRASARPAQGTVPERYAEPCAGAVARTGRPCVGDYEIDPLIGQPTVALAYPIPNADGSIGGVLDLSLNLLSLQRVFASIPLPRGSIVTLTDRNGRVLTRNRDVNKYVGMLITPHPLPPSAVPRITVTKGLDGVENIFGNAVIARGPWVLSVGIPTYVAFDRARPLWRRNLAITIAAVLATVLLALYMMRRISEPIAALTATAQRIAGGDLQPPAPMPSPSLELGRLHEAFTTMAENLRKTREALDLEIERERRARQQVQVLQNQVVRQERLAAVGLLVSGIAHELNNPLQAIVGTAELMVRDPTLSVSARQELRFIEQHSAHARDIIRNLSRFARQEASPSSEIRLGDVVSAALQLRAREAGPEDVVCEVEIDSDRRVIAGFAELQQVVLNFVTNAEQAIAEAGRPGRISLRVRDTGGTVRLEVADNGPGVTAADQPKLFQPFFTTRPVGQGTGLGLSVSYGIIDSYGGTIGYQQNEWGGATFYFELPVWPDVAGAFS